MEAVTPGCTAQLGHGQSRVLMQQSRQHGAQQVGTGFVTGFAAGCRVVIITFFSFFLLAARPAAALAPAESAESAPILSLGSETTNISLTPYLELLEDPEAVLTVADVQSPNHAARFARVTRSPNFGFNQSAWWVRFRLRNDSQNEQQLILRQDYPLIDYLDFWQQSATNRWQHTATGDRRLFALRSIEHRDFLLPLTVPAQTSQEFYVRFQSSGPVDISLSLHGQQHLLEAISKEHLLLGLYYGGFLVLAIYNLFIFLAVRDRTFAYYLLYLVSYGLYMAVHNGLAYQLLWPDNPWLANQSLILLLGLSLLWGLQFGRGILQMASLSPRTDRMVMWLQTLTLACTLIAVMAPYHVMIVPMSALTILATIMMMVMGGIGLLVGVSSARYFVLAWSALLIGVLVYMLKSFGVLPHNSLTQNGFQIGSLIEMILLSLALSSRVNELQHQSSTDPLTKLGNRRLFNERLALAVAHATRRDQPLALLVIDIDHFKQFNDQHGHAAGDLAICTVAETLAKQARKPFLACRYGGEEFVLLLPGVSQAEAAILAERLRQSVQQRDVNGTRVTISVGLATLADPEHPLAAALFDAADFALYTAKAGGRNQVASYRDCHSRRHEAPSAPTAAVNS